MFILYFVLGQQQKSHRKETLFLSLQVWFRNRNQHIQYTSCHVIAHIWLPIFLSPLPPYNLQFLMCIY